MSSSHTSPGSAWSMVMASTVSPAPAITTSDHSLKMVDLILIALAPRTASTSRPVDVEKYLTTSDKNICCNNRRPSIRMSQTGWQEPQKAARSGMLAALAETNTMSVESVSHPASTFTLLR